MESMEKVVAAIVYNAEGEVLSLKRANGHKDGVTWSLPSGKIEASETEEDAIIREVFQETGISCRPVKKIGEHTRHNGPTLAYWVCEFAGGTLRDEAGKTSQVGFRTIEQMAELVPPEWMAPCVRHELGLDHKEHRPVPVAVNAASPIPPAP